MKYELLKLPNSVGQPEKGFYTCPNYFNITNGVGFHNDGDDESFSITGYMPEKQAKLMANADKLYQALSDLIEIAENFKIESPYMTKAKQAIKEATL